MKKVGIITLGGRFNYGNRLQNYASDYIWRRLGYDPTSLYLIEHPNGIKRIKKTLRRLLGKCAPNPETGMHAARLEAFDSFNQHIQMRNLSYLPPSLIDEFTFFSVGSDQVWNPYFIEGQENWYFLNFARRDQRIALSPSIGLDTLTPKQSKLLNKGVSGFNRLSIREKRGASLINEASGLNAEVICDPTLVLTADEWRAVSSNKCTPNDPYVFTYLLGGVCPEAADVLDKITCHGQIPIVSLSDRQREGDPDAGPAEFIDLIDHALHVVTDSFHAAVFSSILHTPLSIVHREGGESMFSRLEQLSHMLCLEDKVYGSPSFHLDCSGTYEGVDASISLEREKFMHYLEECLDQ